MTANHDPKAKPAGRQTSAGFSVFSDNSNSDSREQIVPVQRLSTPRGRA